MSILFILAALALSSATEATTVEAPSPAMAAAVANRPRAKTAPTLARQPEWVRPQAAKDAGEFGEVVLAGIVGEDGRFTEPKVAVSSRSAIIDAAALASTSSVLFEPARDLNGKPLSIPVRFAIEYPQTGFHGASGLGQYRCAQFVRDYDWWYRTWPAEHPDRVYATLRGFVAVAELRTGNAKVDFAAEWKQAIEDCRRAPTQLMLDMLKPHGPMLRGMVR